MNYNQMSFGPPRDSKSSVIEIAGNRAENTHQKNLVVLLRKQEILKQTHTLEKPACVVPHKKQSDQTADLNVKCVTNVGLKSCLFQNSRLILPAHVLHSRSKVPNSMEVTYFKQTIARSSNAHTACIISTEKH